MELVVQNVSQCADVPDDTQVEAWVRAALDDGELDNAVLTVRIVDEPEMTVLNRRYRKQDRPTNVLSFPFEDPPGVHSGILGDIVVCAPVVRREATEQRKTETSHWALIVVHGVMHLRGYGHISEADAKVMEGMETHILTGLGFPAPYAHA